MPSLPYNLSAAITEHGWLKAWKEAREHLTRQGVESREAVRLLCQEPVTVQHRTQGPLTTTTLAALALDVISNHSDTKRMEALERITWEIKDAFRYNFTTQERYVHPTSADEGMALPGLGALWLVTWAHQPDKRFQSRRKHGNSYTNLTWPDQFFMDATGETYVNRLKAQERLMDEAVAAMPLLRSNLDPQGTADFKLEFDSVLHRVHTNWAGALKSGEDKHEAGLFRLFHRTIQSGQMEDRGETPSNSARWMKYQHHVHNFIWGGIREKSTASDKLTRAIDAIVFYMSPSAIKGGNWIERTKKLLDEGGTLNKGDACAEERLARLAKKYPALLADIRTTSANAVTDEKPVPLASRPRLRS